MMKSKTAPKNNSNLVHYREAIKFLLDDLETVIGVKNLNGKVRFQSLKIRDFDRMYKSHLDSLDRGEKLKILKKSAESLTTLSYLVHKINFYRVEVLSFKQHGRFDMLRVLLNSFSRRDFINKESILNLDSLIEYLEILEGYNSKNVSTFSYRYIRLFVCFVAIGDIAQASIVSNFINTQIDISMNVDTINSNSLSQLHSVREKLEKQRDTFVSNGRISDNPNINLGVGKEDSSHDDVNEAEVKSYVRKRKRGEEVDTTVEVQSSSEKFAQSVKQKAKTLGSKLTSNVEERKPVVEEKPVVKEEEKPIVREREEPMPEEFSVNTMNRPSGGIGEVSFDTSKFKRT